MVSRKLDEDLYDFNKKLSETSDWGFYSHLSICAKHENPKIAYSPDGKSKGYEYSYSKPVLDLIAILQKRNFPKALSEILFII